MREHLIFIDDDEDLVDSFLEAGFASSLIVHKATSLQKAKRQLSQFPPAVIILDLLLPDGHGLTLFEEIRECWPFCQVIVLSGHATVQDAIQAMKMGAFDFILKPCRLEEMEIIIQRALEKHRLLKQAEGLKHQLGPFLPQHIVMEDPATRRVFEAAKKVASTDSPVLILGETGVGKEILARWIHHHSLRKDNLFLVVDCSLLQREFLVSELFGHEKGAFTGAYKKKEGLVEMAHGGSLFLDEIGEMDIPLQTKLLRFLETGTYRRLGGTRDLQVSVRIIAASNRPLLKQVQDGTFRKDLYYRLCVFPLTLPPLRERPADILPLSEAFLSLWSKKTLSPEAKEKLLRYPWPGNIRELKNVLERSSILAEGKTIEPEHLLLEIPEAPLSSKTITLEILQDALQKTGGNRRKAAQLLKISERTLYRKIKEFGL